MDYAHPIFDLDCFKEINKNRQIFSLYDHNRYTVFELYKYRIVALGLVINVIEFGTEAALRTPVMKEPCLLVIVRTDSTSLVLLVVRCTLLI